MTSSRHSFRKAAESWLNESAGSVSEKTIEHYRWVLERFVFPNIEGSLEITGEEVEKLVEGTRKEGLSESTLYEIPRVIWKVLSFAAAEGMCEAPAWTLTPSTPKRMTSTAILSPSEEKKLLSYLIENPSPKNLGIYLILTEGLTPGEALAIRWQDISLRKNEIRVLTEKETTPDTRNKYRTLPINERQKIYLKRLSSLPTVYLVSGKPKPLTLSPFRSHFLKVLNELGLGEITLYDLRRTFAVRRLEEGMDYEKLSKVLGQKNSRDFRAYYRGLVSPETRERLEQEMLEARKPRQAPEHTNCIGPDLSPEVVALRQKVEAKKKQLNETLAALEGDLEIIHTLRRSNLAGLGRPREGLYQFIEKVLGDDRDGKMLVEYLRCNMRVADMPSQKVCTVQTIRSRVARGFSKLTERLDAIYAVEGIDILDMFHKLTARIQEIAPPGPVRPGRKHNPTVGNEFKKAMAALDRIVAKEDNGTASQ